MKRLAAAAVMFVVGVALGATAYVLPGAKASRDPIRNGGVFHVSIGFEEFDYVDPALAYAAPTWQLLQATCAKLMNYPDKPLPDGLRAVPEVARSYRVSNGRVYTFNLRHGYRFSDGTKLDARSFAHQIERIRALPSAGRRYVQDIASVVARGYTLVIRLKQPIPDFPARLAMPFFCAVPPGLPVDPEGARPPIHAAGPYYVADYRPGQQVVLRGNRYYHGTRPHHVSRFDIKITSSEEAIEDVDRGAADWGAFRPSAFIAKAPDLLRKYGRKGRLRLRPAGGLRFLVLNTERPLFRDARLRRAVNFAVNRSTLVRELGPGVARPTDQYLPIGFPGFVDAHIYPLGRPNLRRARVLARGRIRGRKAVLYTAPRGITQAQVVKANLAKIGLEVEINTVPNLFDRLATRGEPFDIGLNNWGSDYNDPYAFINVLLDGRRIGRPDNVNWSYFNAPKYNRLMDRASHLSGAARYRAYAKLDRQLARDAAPIVAYAVPNAPTLVSARVDPRCKILRPGLDLAAVCLRR